MVGAAADLDPHRRPAAALGLASQPAPAVERLRRRFALRPRELGLVRTTADGHRITLRPGRPAARRRGRACSAGSRWALLLVLTLLAYAYVRRLLRPLRATSAQAWRASARGDFEPADPAARGATSSATWPSASTRMAHQPPGHARRQARAAAGHQPRAALPLTRARAQCRAGAAEGEHERDALLRDLAEMRDLISDLLESERLASRHAALQREPVDLAALVRELVADAVRRWQRSRSNSPPTLPPMPGRPRCA